MINWKLIVYTSEREESTSQSDFYDSYAKIWKEKEKVSIYFGLFLNTV